MNRLGFRFCVRIAVAQLSFIVFAFAIFLPVYARAAVVRFQFQDTCSDTGAFECLSPSLNGEENGTAMGSGLIIDTNPGFHLQGTENLDYRIDFPDGSFILGTSVEHFEFDVNPLNSRTVSTVAINEPRTIYSTNGQPVGKVRIHYLSHITCSDANGNRQPDPGEITAYVDDFRVTCYWWAKLGFA